MKKIVNTAKAPAAIGPYSQATELEKLIFVSGQLPIEMSTGELANSIETQTKASLENIKAILTENGSSLDKVLKTTVFLQNMDDFIAMNSVYSEYFSTNPPARSTVEVARLPKNALVEIECIAYK
ncbi:RidA family protein [Succinispira mobilis]|uniref:RidA family protein n=1 Tax=Succinispira mobilis TaxID=78120 RepID=UPI00038235FF|nr:RidA family protein [Succinispira mobilis]